MPCPAKQLYKTWVANFTTLSNDMLSPQKETRQLLAGGRRNAWMESALLVSDRNPEKEPSACRDTGSRNRVSSQAGSSKARTKARETRVFQVGNDCGVIRMIEHVDSGCSELQ